jgi:biopolymer transport protein ExbD
MLGIKGVYGRGRHKMNFVPFIDCVFMLIMYFLVATDIRPTEADFVTNVPGRHRGEAVHQDRDIIRVWVADGASGPVVRLDGENGRLFPSFAELVGVLKRSAGPNTLMVIDGPADVSVQTVTLALDATVEAGIPAMTFMDPELRR